MCEFITGKNCISVLRGKNDIILHTVHKDLFHRTLYNFLIILLTEHLDLLSLVESSEETAADETGESGFGKIEPVEKVTLVQQDHTYHNHKGKIVYVIGMLENFLTFARTLS